MPDDEDTNTNLASIYREIETTEELWFASFIIQLDVEAGQLSLVLDHPLCDRGIASFVYWALDPCGENSASVQRNLAELQLRLISGYYSLSIVKFAPEMLGRRTCDEIPKELSA